MYLNYYLYASLLLLNVMYWNCIKVLFYSLTIHDQSNIIIHKNGRYLPEKLIWESLCSTLSIHYLQCVSLILCFRCLLCYRLLRRGSMFVFSTDQIRRLLNMTFFDSGSTLIDLGAGDGATTEKYLPLIREIYTTEKSGPMIRILAEKGFRWNFALLSTYWLLI